MANETKQYQWEGINRQGKRTKGVLSAADAKEVQVELKRMGVEVIRLQEKNKFQINIPLLSRKPKIKNKDILLFTRFLSTMLAAGLSIIRALDIISQDQENPAMKHLLISIKNNISEGKTLGESFSQYPQYFNGLYCNLIKAGEKSGTLDKMLNRLANYLEKTETLKRKIRKALVYPIAILTIALGVSLILLIFVVPQFQKMFESFGAQLPAFTRSVVVLSEFVRGYWWIILILLGGGIAWLRYTLHHSEKMRLFIDKQSLRIYVVGDVLKKGIIARYTRTLATTLEAGMPIIESMRAIAQVMGNSIYTKGVQRICDDVTSGHQLSTAMASTNLFPNMTIQMIAVGEASGRLSEMLNKIADYYEDEVNAIVDSLSSLLEPLIMVILGTIVGSFVIAMYLPIFKIGSLF